MARPKGSKNKENFGIDENVLLKVQKDMLDGIAAGENQLDNLSNAMKNFGSLSAENTNNETIESHNYIVCQSPYLDFFLRDVRRAIDKGFVCQGGVSVTAYMSSDGQEFLYSQAMVRK